MGGQFDEFHRALEARRQLKEPENNPLFLCFLLIFFMCAIAGGLWARSRCRATQSNAAARARDSLTSFRDDEVARQSDASRASASPPETVTRRVAREPFSRNRPTSSRR